MAWETQGPIADWTLAPSGGEALSCGGFYEARVDHARRIEAHGLLVPLRELVDEALEFARLEGWGHPQDVIRPIVVRNVERTLVGDICPIHERLL